MTTFNTGLLLRYPCESAYNACRRFLIANHGETESRILSDLKKDSIKKIGNTLRHTPIELFMNYERMLCEQRRIPYIAPKSWEHETALKNCPECARRYYHSYLYQLPWVQKCPLHGVELTLACQVCGSPWPHVLELKTTPCQACGAQIPLTGLVDAGALRAHPAMGLLENLDKKIAEYLLRGKRLIIPPDTKEIQHFTWHVPPDVQSMYTPGFMRALGHDRDDLFSKCGISVPDVLACSFSLEEPSSDGSDDYFLSVTQSNAIAMVDGALRREIKTHCARDCDPQDKNDSDSVFFDIDRVRNRADLARASLAIWRALVTEEHAWVSQARELPGSQYFHMDGGRTFPPIPRITTNLVTYDDGLWIDGEASPAHCYRIPLNAAQVIYQWELFRCYRSIFGYLDTIRLAAFKEYSRSQWRRALTGVSHPNKWHERNMLIISVDSRNAIAFAPIEHSGISLGMRQNIAHAND